MQIMVTHKIIEYFQKIIHITTIGIKCMETANQQCRTASVTQNNNDESTRPTVEYAGLRCNAASLHLRFPCILFYSQQYE